MFQSIKYLDYFKVLMTQKFFQNVGPVNRVANMLFGIFVSMYILDTVNYPQCCHNLMNDFKIIQRIFLKVALIHRLDVK